MSTQGFTVSHARDARFDRLPPDIYIFTSSKQPWVVLAPNIPAVDEYYERAKYWPKESLERRRVLLAT